MSGNNTVDCLCVVLGVFVVQFLEKTIGRCFLQFRNPG